jgi:hypothetical protein
MAFNYQDFFRHLILGLFRTKNTHMRLGGTRIRFWVVFLLSYPVLTVTSWICLGLDNLLYPKFRQVSVDEPIFIIGNFRSGTTFLHRLLSKDTDRFTSFKTWEIYFAPSITQRQFWRGASLVDRFFGSPVLRRIRTEQERLFGPIRMHRIRLEEPEEDEGLLLHMWAGLFVWFFSPRSEVGEAYAHFDRDVPFYKRRRCLRFYQSCVKRHLYVHGPEKRLVSKNPSFSPKVRSLLQVFPDARFVYLARDPKTMLVSELNWLSYAWHYFASPSARYPFRDQVVRMAHYWYLYPLAELLRLDDTQYRIYSFGTLTRATEATIRDLYDHFAIPRQVGVTMPVRRSGNVDGTGPSVGLAEVGLSEESVLRDFAEVYRLIPFRTIGPITVAPGSSNAAVVARLG